MIDERDRLAVREAALDVRDRFGREGRRFVDGHDRLRAIAETAVDTLAAAITDRHQHHRLVDLALIELEAEEN